MHKLIWPASLILITACTTPATVAPLSVPLQYKTMASPGEFPTLAACSGVSSVRVTDARSETALGKRFIEGKNVPSAAVTTSSDVADWARTAVLEELRRGGVATAKAGAPALSIKIDEISTSENVLHRSGYEGRLAISAELTGANGTSCWKDRSEGFAENYGYAGSVQNYQETLNHALDRAMIRLMSSADFKKALCGC